MIRSSARQLGDVALRFRTLFSRLGPGLEGPGGFCDADAWYCILEGTDQIPVAEAQAKALTDLLADFAVRDPARWTSGRGTSGRGTSCWQSTSSPRSRALPIRELYERARSLGLAVQVSAQSWQGLAATEDERRRLAAAAEGGIWMLRTPYPEPLAELAGTRQAIETTRATGRFPRWRKQGSSRLRDVPLADPELLRRLEVGQVGYVYRGGITYLQVKRLVGAPAAVAARPHSRQDDQTRPAEHAHRGALQVAGQPTMAAARAAAVAGLPDAGPVLDAAFGPAPGSAGDGGRGARRRS